ncbi:MAG: HNH endonuclease signature motif containing protein [Anaerovoracaceae bacterium]
MMGFGLRVICDYKVSSKNVSKSIYCFIGGNFEYKEMEGDHITHWHNGGKTNVDNCKMLCKECNRRKSGI